LRQRHGLIVKGKRISCPPHHDCKYARARSSLVAQAERIRSLRASARRSTSVLFSFVLPLLIMAASFAIQQSKTILAHRKSDRRRDDLYVGGLREKELYVLRSYP
jgi:hypothetical protein